MVKSNNESLNQFIWKISPKHLGETCAIVGIAAYVTACVINECNNFLGHGVSTDECGRYLENHTFDALLHNLIDCMIENISVNRSSVSSMYLFTDILNTRMMKDINQKCFLCVWMPDVTVSTIIKKTIVLNEHQQKQGVALIYRPHF